MNRITIYLVILKEEYIKFSLSTEYFRGGGKKRHLIPKTLRNRHRCLPNGKYSIKKAINMLGTKKNVLKFNVISII